MGLGRIRPLNDYMVVERSDPPDHDVWRPPDEEGTGNGIVQAVGPDVTGCQPGDHVYFSPYLWNSTHVGDNIMMLNEDQILGVVV